MGGFGGRYYWERRTRKGRSEGVVVAFAWMSSQAGHSRSSVKLDESLGWNTLVCHSQFLDMFFPRKALLLAVDVVKELANEVRIRPCPMVFASFSGGPKACMAKVLEVLLEGKDEAQLNMEDDIRLVRDCIAGFIFDSCPVDFTSNLGTRFVAQPTVLKMSHPLRFASRVANGIASGLDALFLAHFESRRAKYLQIPYSTTSIRMPCLILCSEQHDDLAPYQTICNFVQRLQDLGADVKLVTWKGSPHVDDYGAVVTELLGKAAELHSHRVQQAEESKVMFDENSNEISDPFVAFGNQRSTRGSPGSRLSLTNQILLRSLVEYYDEKDIGSVHEKDNTGVIHRPGVPGISADGLLGQILFDKCVPKNVEDWDIKQSSGSYYRRPLMMATRHSLFSPMKCIRRSRL